MLSSVMLGSASHPSTTAIEGRAGPGQRSILSEFNRLQYEGMTPQQSPMALLPEETCFLQIAQAIKNGSNTSGHGCAYRVSSDDEFSRCWFGTHPLVCGLYRPNATYDVASDPLLFRYRRTAPATIADSYLFRVLMETDRATNLHLVGDSTMEQLFKAAQCEVGRAFLARNTSQTSLLQALTKRFHYHSSNGMHSQASNDPIEQVIKDLIRAGTGILVFSFGVHYDDINQIRSAIAQMHLHGNVGSPLSRHDLLSDLQHLLPKISRLSSGCPRCSIIYVTSTSQHFTSSDGTFKADIARSVSNGSFGCKPWPATTNTHTKALSNSTSKTVLISDQWPLSSMSANSWRTFDVVEKLQHMPNVTIIPLHILSSKWWNLHQGATTDNWRGLGKGCGRSGKICIDCTHFCYSPFMFEPVWWALWKAWKELRFDTS